MRIVLVLVAATALAGCVSSVGGPTKLAHGASGAMWTASNPDAIAACITQTLGVSPNGNDIVSKSGNRYLVEPVRGGEGIYKTQVNVIRNGSDTQEEQSKVAECIVSID